MPQNNMNIEGPASGGTIGSPIKTMEATSGTVVGGMTGAPMDMYMQAASLESLFKRKIREALEAGDFIAVRDLSKSLVDLKTSGVV